MGNHDTTTGYTFYGVLLILQRQNPRCFVLENVVQLIENGELSSIVEELEAACSGYIVYCRILGSEEFGLPQLRHRLYIWGFRKAEFEAACFPAESLNGLCDKVMSRLSAGHAPMDIDEFFP